MRLSYSSLMEISVRYHPPITIFEEDYREWFDWAVEKTLQEIRKKDEYWIAFVYESDYYEIWDYVAEISYDIVGDLVYHFPWRFYYLVVVDGSFGLGERTCKVIDFYDDFDEKNRYRLTETVTNTLIEFVRENKRIVVKKGRPVKPKIYRYHERPILSVFKRDLDDWTKDFPRDIVEEIRSGERNGDTPEQIAKEIIEEEIEKILKHLIDRDVSYVNIVFGDLPDPDSYTEEGEKLRCQIVTLEDFANKLYTTAYNSTLKLLKGQV